MKKVIIIAGPTGVGKTKLSLALAKHFQTNLINGDAYQMYQGLDILTAKPNKEELSEVTHFLMDTLKPDADYTIYNYQTDVRNLIEQQDLPLIVGGSGLYTDSVIYDYRFPDNNYSFDDTNYTNEELHQLLKELDPINAENIHPNNRKRVKRAIELAQMSSLTERSQKNTLVYEPLILFLNLDRELLYDRINKRVLAMLENGLLEEVKSDRSQIGFQLSKAIGYNDAINYLDGMISYDEMVDNIQKATRHYAKRQLTWYRKHPNTVFLDVKLDDFDSTIKEAINLINEFLEKSI